MHLCRLLFLFSVGLLFTNARVIKQKRQRIRQRATPCSSPLPYAENPCLSPCSCQNIFLDELPSRSICGCQYTETYGVLSPELPNCGRISAIKLPKITGVVPSCYDALPAINLPESYELVNLPGMVRPGYVSDVACSCQKPMSCQCLETPCGCKMQTPMLEYLLPFEMSSPVPFSIIEPCYVQAPTCQSQIMKLPPCGCSNMPRNCLDFSCNCQRMPCSCQRMPCSCQSMPCSCQSMPCSCQNMPCSCQNVPCTCQNMPCSCQNSLYSCQSMSCPCQTMPCECQNVLQVPQLPGLEMPCACQACQLPTMELPVYGFGCQSLPPPVIDCCGKYLRQVTIPPPFL